MQYAPKIAVVIKLPLAETLSEMRKFCFAATLFKDGKAEQFRLVELRELI